MSIESVWKRCAEMLQHEFDGRRRPTWAELEKLCPVTAEGIAALRDLHRKVKLIRDTQSVVLAAGGFELAEVEKLAAMALGQWTGDTALDRDPLGAAAVNGRAVQASLMALQQGGELSRPVSSALSPHGKGYGPTLRRFTVKPPPPSTPTSWGADA